MQSTYRGAPQRERLKRPSVSRGDRRRISQKYEVNKENMLNGAGEVFTQFKNSITSLSTETGYAQSHIARVALGGKKEKRARGATPFNAWVMVRMREVNSALGAGEKLGITEFQEKYGHEYHKLSQEKKKEYLDELRAKREARILKESSAVRKVGKQAAADIRTVVKNIAESTSTLPDRAGYSFLCFGAKTDYAGTAAPVDMVPDVAKGFCESVLGVSPELLALKYETYLLKGGLAAVELREAKADKVRSAVVDMLRISFTKVCGAGSRIYYSNWLVRTSIAHLVTIENWPADLPYDPKKIKLSRLHEIFDGLHSESIFYRRMSTDELQTAREKAGL